MRRTIETASITPTRTGCAGTRPGLREIDHGHWEGLRRQEVESQFHDEYSAGRRTLHRRARGRRVRCGRDGPRPAVIRAIVEAHAGQQVLVVRTRRPSGLVISSLLGFDARRLSGSAGPGARVSKRAGFQGSGPRTAHALQRRVALCRPAAGCAGGACRSGGIRNNVQRWPTGGRLRALRLLLNLLVIVSV